MKKLLLLILFVTPFLQWASDMDIVKLRNLYYQASISKEASEKFAQATAVATGIDKITLTGYSGMSWMIKANHAFNPYNKLSYFFKGKGLLDGAIKSDEKNVELRFLRYCVQTNAPSFLAYSGNISSDKSVILINYSTILDLDLKKRIKDYLLSSKYCTASEKKILQ
ncbi:MAG: hypothetical protein H0U95_09240 [Bacteroidetes bacterium]|nr:hypothetical protein [Bacteroidota bacterium]